MNKIIIYIFFTNILFADIFNFQTIEKANKAYENGEFSKSATLFNSLSKDDPSVAYDEGNAHYKAGNYDEALNAYNKAEGMDEATRSYNMGNSYFQKKELDKAIKAYEKSLKFKEDVDTQHNLELAKKKKKKEEEQKKKQDKKDDKKKEEKDKKKKEDEEKKKEQDKKDEQKKKDDEKKKEDDKKNADKDKKSDEEKKREAQAKKDKEMSPEEKMRKKELSHLLKQLSKKKMPTMMYQANDEKRKDDNVNPW